MKPVGKILVITLSNLGDVVLTLPVFQALRESYPDASLDTVTSRRAAAVFEGDARIRKILLYDRRAPRREQWALLKAVRAERYDLIVDLRRSWLGLLGGARFRNAFFEASPLPRHRAERHLAALRGIAPPPKGTWWAGPGPREASAPPLVLAAVGSKSGLKKWPAESYARLLDRLAAAQGCRIALIGDVSDQPDAARVAAAMRQPVTDLTGKTPLGLLVEWIRRASLVVTNDSAPLHLAEALDIPTLAIFGPTDPRKYGPRRAGSAAMTGTLFCQPCERAQCRYGHECLRELTPEEVYGRAAAVLQEREEPSHFNILVVRLDRIGDVVLSLPAVSALRRRFPRARISMMVRPFTQALVQGHPDLDEVIVYRYENGGRHSGMLGNARFIREIARRRFDVAFVLHPGNRSYLVPLAAAIPYRIGYDRGLAARTLTRRVPDRRHLGSKHESEYAMDVIRAFGVEPGGDAHPSLPVFPDESAAMDETLRAEGVSPQERLVALHPGASCPSKRWSAERFGELARRQTESGFRPVVLGGSAETPLARTIAETGGAHAVDLTGRLSLRQTAAALKRAELLVSNDSGPVHVAAAVGTRTVAIFGRNQPGLSQARWRALGEGHARLQKDVGCVVCLAHRCPIGFECLRAIGVDEVFAEAMARLRPAENALRA